MHFIINRLINFLNMTTTTDINYTIARYMLTHIDHIGNLTIYDIADACYVSTASVSRFAKKIGYNSYAVLKDDCMSYVSMKDSVRFKPDMTLGLENYVEGIHQSLTTLSKIVDHEKVQTLVQYIKDYKRIGIVGIQFSLSIAMQMQTLLVPYGKYVETPLNVELQLERMKSYGKDDLIIIFSAYGRYLNAYLNELFQIKKNGPKIVFITHSKVVDVESFADLTIDSGNMDGKEFSNFNLYLMMLYIVYEYQKSSTNLLD